MNGEYERIMNGCFEYYPQMRFRETHGFGSNINALHDFIYWYDRCLASVYGGAHGGGGHGEAMAYAPYGLLAFHRFCAQPGVMPQLEFPRADGEMKQTLRQNKYTVASVLNNADARCRLMVGPRENLILEFLSPLVRIMAPKFRSVNAQLLKPLERKALNKLAYVMNTFRVNYIQEKVVETGQYAYRLEPYG